MASPFKVFRKNQKAALAVLGVLVIIGFVILPAYLQTERGGGGYKNPVVVETSEFGDLKQSDISKLLNRRQVAIRFATNIRSQVAAQGGRGEAAYYFLRRIGSAPSEQAVVRDWLLICRAKRAGIVVSDKTINRFIEQLTEGFLDDGEIQGMLGNMNVRPRFLFEVLRDELLAREMDLEIRLGLMGTTPGQRWDYFRRLERFATVEVVPVPVGDYVSKVTQKPDNATLEEFFDENKNRIANPDSPKWGFRRPKKVSLRYFKADVEKFLDADAVTDEEVTKYYEDNRELYDQWAKVLSTVAPADDGDQPDDAEEPGDAEKPGETEKPDGAEKPDTSADPAVEGDTGTEPDAEPSDASEKPADTSADTEEQESGDRPSDGDSSSTKAASPLRFVSLLQEETPENETDDAASADAEQPTTTSEPSETESDTPAAEGEPEAKAPEGDEIPEPALPPVPPKDRTPVEPEQEPVDPLVGRIGEKIRNDIAYEKASERVDEILELLKREMKRYRRGKARAKGTTSGPKELDFKKLAAQYGLDEGYLEQKSRREMAQTEVGDSTIDGSPFTNYIYDTRRDQLYLPMKSGRNGNSIRFLSWKETETESRVAQQDKEEKDRIAPSKCHGVAEFDEPGIAAEVLEAWKTEQARPLAVGAAEALAKQASESGQPLAKVFPDHDVKTTEPFTWLTFGSVPAGLSQTPPKVSEVEGVDRPGPDFFRKVLAMEAGDVGVAMNYPQTIAYVIRVVEVHPTREGLWRDFQTDVTFHDRVYQSAGMQDMYEINVALNEELESAAGLKWLRPADRNRNE